MKQSIRRFFQFTLKFHKHFIPPARNERKKNQFHTHNIWFSQFCQPDQFMFVDGIYRGKMRQIIVTAWQLEQRSVETIKHIHRGRISKAY